MTAAPSAQTFPTDPKAGFWARFVAYVIDSFVSAALGFVVGLLLGAVAPDASEAVAQAIGAAIGFIYLLYFWSGAGGGQTPGMRVLGLRVIRTDGSLLTYGRAALRLLGMIVASIPLLIGLIWVAFDKNKQGWHDKIADTYVVRIRSS